MWGVGNQSRLFLFYGYNSAFIGAWSLAVPQMLLAHVHSEDLLVMIVNQNPFVARLDRARDCRGTH